MTDTTCVACSRPMADQAYACTGCTSRATGQLQTIADMTPAARDVAHGLSRRAAGAGSSGKPGSRLPLDLGATSKLDAVQASLGSWVRHVLEERGSPAERVGSDPIVHAAWYLQAQLEWWRHRPEVDEFLADVAAAARVVAGIARGPVAHRYLGPCGAPIHGSCDNPYGSDTGACATCDVCEGDVYGREGASSGRCRSCGAEVSTAERQAWLDAEVRSRAFRASEIQDAYGINANLIRQWATPARDLVQVHGHDLQGRAMYLLSQVLDVAAGQAVKRAQAQAKRARSEATRAESDAA